MASHISHSAPEKNSIRPAGKPGDPSAPESGPMTDRELRWREALVLWLRWNEAYEHVTANMFQSGRDKQQLEAMMDRMDAMRREAIAMSHELLD